MGKGLPRSLAHADPQKIAVVRQHVDILATASVVAVTTANGTATVVIGDFPEGNILFLGAVAYLQASGSGSDANLTATWTGSYSVGSAPNADVDLVDAGDANIIAAATITAATAQVSPLIRSTNATAVILDNTDGSLELNLNIMIDAAAITDSATVSLKLSGTVDLIYSMLSDD